MYGNPKRSEKTTVYLVKQHKRERNVRRRFSLLHSVTLYPPFRIGVCRTTHLDLLLRGFFDSKVFRKLADRKIPRLGRFHILRKRTGERLTEDEGLDHTKEVIRNVVPPPILYRDQSPGFDGQSRFFCDLFFGIGKYGLIHVTPSAGQRPCTVFLVYQKDPSVVVKNRRTCIDLWRLVA